MLGDDDDYSLSDAKHGIQWLAETINTLEHRTALVLDVLQADEAENYQIQQSAQIEQFVIRCVSMGPKLRIFWHTSPDRSEGARVLKVRHGELSRSGSRPAWRVLPIPTAAQTMLRGIALTLKAVLGLHRSKLYTGTSPDFIAIYSEQN